MKIERINLDKNKSHDFDEPNLDYVHVTKTSFVNHTEFTVLLIDIVVLAIVTSILSITCDSNHTGHAVRYTSNTFEKVEYDSTLRAWIVYDKTTRVMYIMDGDKITVILNADGTPKLY